MKVALDTRPSSDPSGVGRYSRCLLAALRDTVAVSDQIAEIDRPAALARSRGADVFHSPWIDGAMLHCSCPMVVTVHDLASFKRRSEHLRTSVRMRLRLLALQRAAKVIVPTEAVAVDAVRHLRLERERIAVIAEAADASMYERSPSEIAAVKQRFALPERYLLWVGSLQHPEPGKHLAKLAATSCELPLVLAGPTRPWAHELPGVILTGAVADEQLAAIYSGAHALVLPSSEEGFGLPAVEALACGTPVAACEGPALREVLGERATFVPRGDMDGLVRAAEAATRPAPPPPRWSWQDAARASWGVYAEVSGAEQSRRPAAVSRRRGGTAPPGWSSAES